MMVYCAVVGCQNGRKSERIPFSGNFHQFPIDVELRKKWMYLCGRSRKKEINLLYARICSLHFIDTDYDQNREKYESLIRHGVSVVQRLNPDAYPTKKLPAHIKLDEIK